MNALEARLLRLLDDPRTRVAAQQAGKRWQETEDDSRLERDLDFIEQQIASIDEEARLRADAERKAREQAEAAEARARSAILELEGRGVPQPALEELIRLADVDPEGVVKRADAMRKQVEEIRRGQPGLPMVWRGVFSPGVEYARGDVVRFKGAAYVAIGITLSEPPQGAWELLVERLESVSVGGGGGRGPQGPPGAAGPQNLFVQETDPGMTSPGVWFELRGDGTVRTIWVENGV